MGSLEKDCFRLYVFIQLFSRIYNEEKLKCNGIYRGRLCWNRQWVVDVIMMYDATKSPKILQG